MKTILVLAVALLLPLVARATAAEPLSKTLYELDDFYLACVGYQTSSESLASTAAAPAPGKLETFRQTIQFEVTRDTVWVKTFITIDSGAGDEALVALRRLSLRGLSRFGDICAAQIPIQTLPRIEQLEAVRSIEPVTPAGAFAQAARTAAAPTAVEIPVKKN